MVKRKVSITAFHAQGRRINCGHCGEPYTFVEGDTSDGVAQGNALMSDKDELARTAFRRVASSLEKRARKEQKGEGRCPHCHQLQAWMIKNSRMGNMGCFGAIGLVVGIIGTVVLYNLMPVPALALAVGILGTLVLGAAGAGGGLFLAEKPGAQPDEADARVKTDEQLASWMSSCAQKKQDPMLAWWVQLGNQPPGKAMTFSLGLLDLARPASDVPEPWSTEGRIRALDRMD